MVRVASLVVVAIGTLLLVLLFSGRAEATDVIPFFTPDPRPVTYGPPLPDPDVPECSVGDRACLERHDAEALESALATNDDERCARSRNPPACRDAFDMITGNVGMRADPILDDPCSWVVLVDHGTAVIESRRLGRARRYADRGWKPRTFLGACDLSRLTPLVEATVPMPVWEPRIVPAGATGRRSKSGQGGTPRPDRGVVVQAKATNVSSAPPSTPVSTRSSPQVPSQPALGIRGAASNFATPAPATVRAPAAPRAPEGAPGPAPSPSTSTAPSPWSPAPSSRP